MKDDTNEHIEMESENVILTCGNEDYNAFQDSLCGHRLCLNVAPPGKMLDYTQSFGCSTGHSG
jgi:hypothetical protein